MIGDMYDWKITVKKGLFMIAKVFIAGTLSMIGSGEINVPVLVTLVPVFELIENWLKHRNDDGR